MPKRTDIKKILLIGSGPIVIGQACEFDYSGTQGAKALTELGYDVRGAGDTVTELSAAGRAPRRLPGEPLGAR